eukprot:646368-Prymnesium_polylepis.1
MGISGVGGRVLAVAIRSIDNTPITSGDTSPGSLERANQKSPSDPPLSASHLVTLAARQASVLFGRQGTPD